MGGDRPGAARPPGRRTRGPRAAGARPSGRTAGAGPARYRRAGPPAPPARPGPRRSPAGRCPACRRRRSRAEGRGRRSDPAWVRDPDRGRRSARARGWATGPGRRSARARGGLSGRVRAAPARPGGVGRPRLRRGLRRRGPVRAARLGRLIPPVRCAGCDRALHRRRPADGLPRRDGRRAGARRLRCGRAAQRPSAHQHQCRRRPDGTRRSAPGRARHVAPHSAPPRPERIDPQRARHRATARTRAARKCWPYLWPGMGGAGPEPGEAAPRSGRERIFYLSAICRPRTAGRAGTGRLTCAVLPGQPNGLYPYLGKCALV
ncbi:hypothetical protein HNR12_002570 [Streptomonospora nanhaiensis]|uniref:Uncharacterized protein n=1 Tax=Streptomonospora nanhaiensis TaxID=1323731 RepID=A0A853BM39_9ACTN|nr:hypothetical protein [Streptomonospora nanhaiensis]